MGSLPDKKELEEVLCTLLKKVLAVESIEYTARFSELGGTSLQAVLFQQQLQLYVGNRLKIPTSIILDYPSIATLSDYIYCCLHGEKLQIDLHTRSISLQTNPLR